MASQQYDLNFSGRLSPQAQRGMEACDANADDRWKRVVDGCIQIVARNFAEFTSDEVLAELERLPNPPSTKNLAALGPRMKKVAAELGYMAATEKFKRSERPEKNSNLHRVWRSNLFRKTL